MFGLFRKISVEMEKEKKEGRGKEAKPIKDSFGILWNFI